MDDKDMYVISGSSDVTLSIDSTALPSFTIDDLQGIDLSGNIDWNNMNSTTILSTSETLPYGNSYTSWNYDANVNITSEGITVKDGCDIKLGGHSLSDFIKTIEDRLAILHPNKELEEKWEQLKDLRRQYEALEKDILEKEKIMKILKED